MELRHLRAFVAIVEEGSLSAAAQRHHVSQPALSQQVQALEQELGEPLLHRRPRGVEPTAAGALLVAHARHLLVQAERLREEFRNRRELESGRIAFGIIPTLAPYLLPQLLGEFRKNHPGVKVEISESRTDQLVPKVGGGDLEFAILSGAPAAERKRSSLLLRELFREPLLLAVPEGHPLAARKAPPSPRDLDPGEVIHLTGGHCLAERTRKLWVGCKSDSPLQCDQMATALAMVSAGLGVTIVPKLAARALCHANVVCRPFAAPGLDRPIHLLKRRGPPLTPAAARLLSTLV